MMKISYRHLIGWMVDEGELRLLSVQLHTDALLSILLV
jgi:hypothetical protein